MLSLANFLKKQGVVKGDRIAAYMPNVPETVIMMLAASSIGAIFSSASPDFGVDGVLDRFGQIEPKILITTDGYWYNGKEVNITNKGHQRLLEALLITSEGNNITTFGC